MITPAADALTSFPTPTSSASRFSRRTGEDRELTTSEQQILDEVVERCERSFDGSSFFRTLAAGAVTPAALHYVFGQYGYFRLQLHRWFAACMILAKDASQPEQRQAILALADHVFTDLSDGHDDLFAVFLCQLGFPAGSLHARVASPATTRYVEYFLDDCRRATMTWGEAVAALGGREISVALRNQRLLSAYFAPRGLPEPAWVTLHAELEVDHFLDLLRPVLARREDAAPFEAARACIERACDRHIEYLDALLREHAAEAAGE